MKMLLLSLTVVMLAGCGGGGGGTASSEIVRINGAGATFPMPIYQRWFADFKTSHPNVEINYGGGGSGAGIRQLTDGTVDFGASDMPLKDEEIAAMKVKPLHFPTVIGAVVISYNVEGVGPDLKLTPDVITDLLMGKIKKWNDPRLAALNPGVKFPAADIVPVHRSDASGTTFIFTDYLSKISPEWKSKVGANTKVAWPVEGLNGQGNPGVAGLLKQTPGSFGYVELIYAVQNKMNYAQVQNAAGNMTKATLESVTEAAAAAAKDMPADFRVSITNPPGANAYPIASYTWLLIPSRFADAKKGAVMRDFLKWMLTEGQKIAASLTYAPLPPEVASKALAQVDQVQ
jgi:phosphate transport system substrate-binding protein